MAFTVDLPEAARRAQRAAQTLDHGQRPVAGYLFGIAAECAIKQVAQSFPPLRARNISHVHFPALKHNILDVVAGRSATVKLRKALEPSRFFSEWNIDVRYAPNREVTDRMVDRWREDATVAIALMESS